jgi:hypothetical protein
MVGAALLALAAVVVAAVTVVAGVGRLRRNSIAGIRIPSLYASDEAWMHGHRAAIVPTAASAIVCVVIAAILLTDPAFALVGTILETAVLVIGVLLATVLAGRAARRRDNTI